MKEFQIMAPIRMYRDFIIKAPTKDEAILLLSQYLDTGDNPSGIIESHDVFKETRFSTNIRDWVFVDNDSESETGYDQESPTLDLRGIYIPGL